jgi:glycosyltransferase involved in cell wall biosynthesis
MIVRPMKVIHIIVDLDVGGAELMLDRLIGADLMTVKTTVVISLTSLGLVGESLRDRGVCVHTMGMSSFLQFPLVLWQLIKLIRKYQPTNVQTWMYHADLLGGLAARMAGAYPVVWNIRSTAIPQGAWSVTYWLVRFCAILSYFIPARIICCASSSMAAHAKLHYAAKIMTVIPNGFNFSEYSKYVDSRGAARLELGISENDIIIGVVGRFDPLKDFANFVVAASVVSKNNSNAKFLMIGRENEWSNTTLRAWIEGANLADRFFLVGQQTRVPHFLLAMDIFCLSSVSEAFPNVLVEAMAMALPCVVTNAGDAADILGDARFVAPVKDPEALADALLRMCDLDLIDRQALGQINAEEVQRRYEISDIRRRYEAIYDEVSTR